jgi:hypothetical protein
MEDTHLHTLQVCVIYFTTIMFGHDEVKKGKFPPISHLILLQFLQLKEKHIHVQSLTDQEVFNPFAVEIRQVTLHHFQINAFNENEGKLLASDLGFSATSDDHTVEGPIEVVCEEDASSVCIVQTYYCTGS